VEIQGVEKPVPHSPFCRTGLLTLSQADRSLEDKLGHNKSLSSFDQIKSDTAFCESICFLGLALFMTA
jgi:hypothetical protein